MNAITSGAEPRWTQSLDQMDADDLRALVQTLPVIEQAKGMLMAYYGCDAATAFALLRRWSSTRHVKLRDLTAALVNSTAAQRGQGRAPQRRPAQALADFLTAAGLHDDPHHDDPHHDDPHHDRPHHDHRRPR